jgi:hypothetical protein
MSDVTTRRQACVRTPVAWRTIGVVAVAAAICASVTWVAAVPLGDVALEVEALGGGTQKVGIASVVVSSLLVAGAGGALLRWWQGRSVAATRQWTVVAVAVAVLSLVTPTSAVTREAGMTLVSLHAVVAAVVIVGLRRASRG